MIHPLLATRRSLRAFDEGRPVAPEIVLRLIEAVRWAPSAGNSQPWRLVVTDDRDVEQRARLRETLEGGNAWAKKAPVLVLVCAKLAHERDGSPNGSARHDVGLATENLLLQASHEGLVCHPMGGFDATAARIVLSVPQGYEPTSLIALGWPGDPEALPEPQRSREGAPRRRKEPAEIAFFGSWPPA